MPDFMYDPEQFKTQIHVACIKVTGYVFLINIHKNKKTLYLPTAMLLGSIHSPTITVKTLHDVLQAIYLKALIATISGRQGTVRRVYFSLRFCVCAG